MESVIGPQLEDFNREILVFLNKIEELSIRVDNEVKVFRSDKSRLPDYVTDVMTFEVNEVAIDEKIWTVYSLTEALPKKLRDPNIREPEYFNLRVAINEELSGEYNKLFTYFPTKLSLHLPCMVHGTFELDPSRKYLTESEKNPYHFEQLAVMMTKIAEKLRENANDWRPYRLLSPLKLDSDDNSIKAFYANLIAKKSEVAVLPCLDSRYRLPKNAVFHGQEFSSFVSKHGFESLFPSQLIPLDEDLLNDKFIADEVFVLKTANFIKAVEEIAGRLKNMESLAELIRILASSTLRRAGKHIYGVLLNREKKLIPSNYTAFTPVSRTKEFNRPEYVKFDFMHRALFEALVNAFQIKPGSTAPRELQIKLREHFSIQTYEPAQVIMGYISTAKKELANVRPMVAKKIILEMVNALYVVHRSLPDGRMDDNSRVDDVIAAGVPLLTKANKIQNNTGLVFGSEYPEGKLTEEIFHGVYTSDNYLAGPGKWGLENEDTDDVQAFFKWLKVGSYSQFETWSERGSAWHREPYIDYIYKTQPKADLHTSIHASGVRVKGLDQLLKQVGKGISREQILVWLFRDTKLRQALIFTQDKFHYSYGGRDIIIQPKKNYIQWQFFHSGTFRNYVIADRDIEIINPFQINYDHHLFRSNGITASDVDRILLLIGACQSFDDLPVNEVFGIIRKLEEQDIEMTGKYTATVYRLALKNFSEPGHAQEAIKHAKVPLFAKKGTERAYKPASEVYYAENHTLPLKVIENLWMLNYPKRGGERQIREFLGTRTFDNLMPKIIDRSIKVLHALQLSFQQFMSEARIYILAFRIESLKSPEEKQKAADALSEMEILLVEQCLYTVDDGQAQELQPGEFIHDEDKKYYFRVPSDCSSFYKLERLTSFRDAFAEMFCVQFKVTELKKDFRNIVAIGLQDTRHVLENDYEGWVLQEARDLTQINLQEMAFWKRIVKHLSLTMPSKGLSRDKFIEEIKRVLNIQLPANYRNIDFEKLNDEATVDLLIMLRKKHDIAVDICCPSGLAEFHYKRLHHLFDNYENVFGYHLWQSLSGDIKLQKTFYKRREKYQGLKTEGAHRLAKQFQFAIGLNYDTIVRESIKNFFKIRIRKGEDAPLIITLRYQSLRDKFAEEWEGLSYELISLAFYPGNLDRLKRELSKIRSDGQAEDEKPGALDGEDDKPQPPPPSPAGTAESIGLHFVTLNRPHSKTPVPVARKSGRRPVFDIRMNKNFYNAGKEAERMVRDKLVAIYKRGNVRWISGYSDEVFRDDTAGYDIKYREHKDAEWVMVEVKSAANDAFIISSNEVEKGIANKERYFLALIKNKEIFMVQDFFMDPGWAKDFYVEGNYTAVPKDWFVSYVID